ncbi:hybrid sensor histidine kinase/response regulator [Zoogloea dura]|uniref:Chemotaxis protein CheA n=1 Tax=Zoogloea dura TaxID=2728840 RepID=A0A848GB67_9RHOO|nr:Hpt domain-containing protein [Zoogloea dura]NML26771.1 response regulator [Zoogloea dura]
MSSAHELDLGPLTWVKGEIDLALERAVSALAEAGSAPDRLGRIKFAQTHVHQAHGALSIVGLDGLTQFSEQLDRLLGDMAGGQIAFTPEATQLATRSIAAIGNYLEELAHGQPDQALRLFSLYAELAAARGQEAPTQGELFYPDLSRRPAFAAPVDTSEDPKRLRALRGRFERGLLKWFRNGQDPAGPLEMREAVAGIEQLQGNPASRAFWFAATAFFDALAQLALPVDAGTKRLCGRIDAQMRRVLEGSGMVAERLMRDVLYQAAVATCETPVINTVREAYDLQSLIPGNNRQVSDTPQAPLLRSLREGISEAKEAWAQFANGSAIGLPRFQDILGNLPEQARQLDQPEISELLEGLGSLARWLRQDPLQLSDALSMDVATAMLLVENRLELHGQADLAGTAQENLLCERLKAHQRGERLPPLPLAKPEAQARQLGRQLAHEILSSLAEVEQSLDGYFRAPSESDVLNAVRAPLKQIEGALSIMNEDGAVRLLQDAAARIGALSGSESAADITAFEEIAHRLSALGIYIEALQHGPADLERILHPEQDETPDGTSIEAELDQQKRDTAALAAALKDNPDDDGLRTELQVNLENLRQDASLTANTELEKQARQTLSLLDAGELFGAEVPIAAEPEAPALSAEASRLLAASEEELDAELLGIFIEEAVDVRATIAEHLALLTRDPDDTEVLTTIRRSFHTLKGSGRMVGLKDFGEAAWGIEQTLNHWLRVELPVSSELLSFIGHALAEFSAWIDQLQAGAGTQRDVTRLQEEAAHLRDEGSSASPRHAPEVEAPAAEAPAAPPEAVSGHPVAPEEDEDLQDVALLDESQEVDLEATLVMTEVDLAATSINLPMSMREDEEAPSEAIELDFPELSFDDPALAGVAAAAVTGLPAEAPPAAALPGTPDEALTDLADAPLEASLPDLPEAGPDEALEHTEALEPDESFELGEPSSPAEHPARGTGLTTAEADAFDFDFELTPDTAQIPDIEAAELFDALRETRAAEAGAPESLESVPIAPPSVEALDIEAIPFDEDVLIDEGALLIEDALPPVGAELLEASAPLENIDFAEEGFEATELEPLDDLLTEEFAAESIDFPVAGSGAAPPDLSIESAEPSLAELEALEKAEAAALGSPDAGIVVEEAAEPLAAEDPDEVRLGDVSLSRPLFDLYLAEARQHVATLRHELARLAVNPSLVPPTTAIRAAHTLAGISGTARFSAPQQLAKALELAEQRLADHDRAPTAAQTASLTAAATALEGMLVTLTTRQLPAAEPALVAALDGILVSHLAQVISLHPANAPAPAREPEATEVRESAAAPRTPEATPAPPPLRDELDLDLLPIFLDEGSELLDSLSTALRAWRDDPDEAAHASGVARLLHTLKGSARMVGAMNLGHHLHELETRFERARNQNTPTEAIIEDLEGALDQARQTLDGLQQPGSTAAASTDTPVATDDAATAQGGDTVTQAARTQLRVEASRIDQFVNEAGEISIARTRIEGEMRTLRRSLLDLTENVIRLRNQLREVEIQADTQMQSRLSQVETQHTEFDPLEMDRYTRLQELTRMMAESVGDVTTVQQNLLKNLDGAEAALHAQSRMARELQQSLMHVRMVPFDSLAERLYRLVRQTAKEVGRRANLDIVGGQIEIDRSVLEAMTGPLGHLVRNAVAHGIETPERRRQAGKPEIGQITLKVSHEGNEVVIEFRDDGAGLDFDRIRTHALESGLISRDEDVDDKRLTNLIFVPGFTTATLSSLAGRGVGMDVVKSETAAVGGRISVETESGQGTCFRIHLPLTLAVTQALLVKAGGRTFAIPSSMVAQVLELKAPALEKIRQERGTEWLGEHYGYRYLPRLLGDYTSHPQVERFNWVLLLRAGSETLALHVDTLRGNQEVVVKNAGPQYARMVGYSGATVLGDGEIVLILNPVALAARSPVVEGDDTPLRLTTPAVPSQPLVMVVDDSLTVRKITGRLLEREGYRVITAKDGVDALEQLQTARPDVIIADIEMPRMDGFDLTRNIRADAALKRVPIIMITSRTAEKHKRYAEEIGVNHYLGKPYDEDVLLGLIQGYVTGSST